MGGSGLDELRTTEIGDDEMAGDVDEDILRLQVSMDNPGPVESIDRENEFTGIKLGRIRVECAVFHQMSEEVPAGTKILFSPVSTSLLGATYHLR